jgi:hypothetical protein
MELCMRILAVIVVPLVAAGCLDPLVTDTPGASRHLLPAGTEVPSATDNSELARQIRANDGVEDGAVAEADAREIPRGTGMSTDMSTGMPVGVTVRFWSFGPTTRAPSPLYDFFRRTGPGPEDLERIVEHPSLISALPGDPGYSPVHGINEVVVTDAYNGELITTMEALADAIALGLVEEPVPIKMFVASPIVLPSKTLEVGVNTADGTIVTITPETIFARGHTVATFRFLGDPELGLGLQPIGISVLPVRQVSFLRERLLGSLGGSYDATRPIFQATVPTMPPTSTTANYSPLSIVINVDLADEIMAASITQDSDLFVREPPITGDIVGTTTNVAQFQITSSILFLQLQFLDGMP